MNTAINKRIAKPQILIKSQSFKTFCGQMLTDVFRIIKNLLLNTFMQFPQVR